MANEFKVKKGLIVNGSGSVILDVRGSQGQLFSVTDNLSGSLFSVADISGVPVFDVFSSGRVGIGTSNPAERLHIYGGNVLISGSSAGTELKVQDGASGAPIRLSSNGSGEAFLYIGGENSSLRRTGGDLNLFANSLDIKLSTNNGSTATLFLDTSHNATFAGNIELGSSKRIRWGAGDAQIEEGVTANYALDFSTYDGSNMTTALTLLGNNNATFTGTVTAATTFIADAVDATNSDPGTDNVRFSGYGLIGNRGNLYVTNFNSSGTVQIGVGGAHNASPKLAVSSNSVNFFTSLTANSDSSYDIGTNSTRFKDLYVDEIDGGNSKLLTSDANNYFRINTSGGSAQLGLFRINSGTTGGGYIGIDGANFRIYNESFSPKLTLSTSTGDATFTGNVLIPSGYVGRDSHNRINFDTDDSIILRVADTYRARFDSDGLKPYADSNYNLGSNSLRWASVYTDAISALTNVSIGGDLNINSDFAVLNKAQTAYIDIATRDTTFSEVVYNLSNIGDAKVKGKVLDYDTKIPNQNLLDDSSIKIAKRDDIYANATKTTFGDYVAKYVNDGTGGSTIRIYVDDGILVDGDTYMVSVYYENLIGALTIDFADVTVTGNGTQTGTSSSPKSGRIYGYASRSDYTSTYRFVDINLSNGSGNEVTLHSPKVEAGETLTDFVANERSDMPSNSKHLKDLKVTNNAIFEQGIDVNFGGSNRLNIGGDVDVQGTTDFAIPQGRKLKFDTSGGHTYISEESDSNLKVYVAGTEVVNFTNDFTQFSDPVKPTGNGTHDLGGSTNRWATVYASNINTNSSSTFGHNIVLDDHVDHSPEIQFINQNNESWEIYNNSSGKLQIEQGGAGRVELSSGGLELKSAGELIIPSYIRHAGDPSDDTYFGFSGNDTFVVFTAGGKGIEIDSNRKVTFPGDVIVSGTNGLKINTTSDLQTSAERLSVNGLGVIKNSSTTAATLYIQNHDTTANTIQPYIFLSDSGGNRGGLGVETSTAIMSVNGQGGLKFQTGASGVSGTEALLIDNSQNAKFAGKVGIGTTSSGQLLSIGDSSGNSFIDINKSTSGENGIIFNNAGSRKCAIIQNSSEHLEFHTLNNNVRMIIQEGGNVGIATTNPVQPLQVNGSIYSNGGEFFVNNNSGLTAVGDLIFKTHNGSGYQTTMHLDGADNKVGIGTTTPVANLEVAGAGAQLRVGPRYSSGGDRDFVDIIANGTDSKVKSDNERFHIENSLGDIIITPSGNVGIGTTTPGSFNSRGRNLVVNSSGDTGITIAAGSSDSSTLLFADGTGGTAAYRGIIEYDHNGDAMIFSVGAAERMRINSSGHVGIGTSSNVVGGQSYRTFINGGGGSQAGLGIAGKIRFAEEIAGFNQYSNKGSGQLYALTSKTAYGQSGVGNGTVALVNETSTTATGIAIKNTLTGNTATLLSVFRNNNVGSTSFSGGGGSPTTLLKLTGQAHLVVGYSTTFSSVTAENYYSYGGGTTYYLKLNNTGTSLNARGDVVAFASSDIRMKEDIRPLENSLDKLDKIKGVKFKWNNIHKDFKGKEDIGVIAQDVEKVLPEIVTTRDTGYKAVDYQKLSVLLIESVKELKKEVEELKKKINN